MSVTIQQSQPTVQVNSLGGVTVRRRSSQVKMLQSPTTVMKQRRNVVTIIGGKQGIAGPPGSGMAMTESYTAAANLGGHRAVGLNGSGQLVYADSNLEIPAIGVLRDAVTTGNVGQVYTAGKVNGFAGLATGEIYFLNTFGAMSTIAPTAGIVQIVGVASSSSELSVNVEHPTYY
jgi:hypothetical protein